ncbi:MAG: sulfatase-like hydrolase/transferase, partial [Planctomycetota bacterium]
HVVSPVPMTLPSHSSMLTGTNPLYHGVHENVDYRLEKFNLTLPEVLREKGYTTGAIISSFVLDSKFGLSQGFDTYNDHFIYPMSSWYGNERRGDEASRLACDWLEKHQSDLFFLFLHYFDPHQDYLPPEPFATLFKDDLYAGEIAYTDSCIGQVLRKLKDLGIYDSTLLIITSDHGEGLGEHTEQYHGFFIYQSTIKVPLIIRVPGGPKGKKVPDVVGLVDVAPTICGLLGIDTPRVVHGKDLSPLFKKRKNIKKNKRYIYCESLQATQYGCGSLLGVVADRWKYIQAPEPELYDLDKDPGESKNLVDDHPKRARFLQAHLSSIVEEQTQTNASDDGFVLDNESRRRLESLGYISTAAVVENFDFDETKDDPKNWIRLHQQVQSVRSYIRAEQYPDAETICRQILVEHPKFSLGYFFMGKISFGKNDASASILYFSRFLSMIDKTISRQPENTQQDFLCECASVAYRNLGTVYFQQGNYDKALAYCSKALQIAPGSANTYYNVGNLYLKLGQLSEALAQYNSALALDPNFSEAHYNLGITLSQMARFDEAVAHYKKALHLKPDWPEAFDQMAKLKAVHQTEDIHKPDEAVQLAQLACRLTGYNDPGMLDTLGIAFAAAKRFPEAIETAQKALYLSQLTGQDQPLADEIRKRLQLYKSNKSYYESVPSPRK